MRRHKLVVEVEIYEIINHARNDDTEIPVENLDLMLDNIAFAIEDMDTSSLSSTGDRWFIGRVSRVVDSSPE